MLISKIRCFIGKLCLVVGLGFMLWLSVQAIQAQTAPEPQFRGTAPEMLKELKDYPCKLLFEAYHDGNFDLWIANADGSNPVNLTKTPDVNEFYPKVSPDGQKVAFQADEGQGKNRTRSIYLMNINGSGRCKIADAAREPCWSADGKFIAFPKNEFGKFSRADYASTGIFIYELATGKVRQHPNKKIEHLYTLNWSPDGKWFVATIHGGMGFGHAILALTATDDRVFDLHLSGCRPDLSPDLKKVSWCNGDFAIGVADLDLNGPTPKATNIHNLVQSAKPMETYHSDWSPDGRYIAFSFGDHGEGKHLNGAPENPGTNALGWNICVADTTKDNRWVMTKLDGSSCKEPEWVPVKKGSAQ